MIPGPEVLLVLAAIGLYLQDSLLLLQVNEAMMVRRSRGPWRAAFGSRRWRLSGREPFLPNPFAPHAQSYRLLWRMDGEPGDGRERTGRGEAEPGMARPERNLSVTPGG